MSITGCSFAIMCILLVLASFSASSIHVNAQKYVRAFATKVKNLKDSWRWLWRAVALTKVIITYPSPEGIELLKKPCKQKEDYNFCFTTLQTDSRSRHANLFGLNITAMEIVIKKVTSTLSYISQLLKQKTDRCTKLTLEFGIEELRAKQYHDVNWKISGVIETADFCQSGLTPGGCGGAAALTRQNQNLKNLGNLALSPFSNS